MRPTPKNPPPDSPLFRQASSPVLGLLLFLVASAGPAQVPDTFENLQVLPKDISKLELIGVMRGYSSALGVRCIHCHLGDDPRDLSTVDFQSDDREAKRVARAMMRMVTAINQEYLPKTGRESLLPVGCATCHHGITRPQALSDLVRSEIREKGLESAMARYRELREEHFGRSAYDFGPQSLNPLVEEAAAADRMDEALALSQLNLEFHPDHAYGHYLRARVLESVGRLDEAEASLKRALELTPESAFFRRALEKLHAARAEAPS